MFCKIANENDLVMLSMNEDMVFPELDDKNREKMFLSMEETIRILSKFYGANRNSEVTGGFVILFYGECALEQRKKFMSYYHLTEDSYELKDTVTEGVDGCCWVSEAHIGTKYNDVMYYKSAS